MAWGQGDRITEIRTDVRSHPKCSRNAFTTGRTQVANSPGPLERTKMSTVMGFKILEDGKENMTDLINAANTGDVSTVEGAEQYADVNAKDDEGATALTAAAEAGNTAIVQKLLADGADVNSQDNDGWTPLMSAAAAGHRQIVQLLLETGADVNAKTNFGLTALMSAAGSGRTEVVQFLLDQGADIKAKDHNTWTALIWASSEGHQDAVEVLKRSRDRY